MLLLGTVMLSLTLCRGNVWELTNWHRTVLGVATSYTIQIVSGQCLRPCSNPVYFTFPDVTHSYSKEATTRNYRRGRQSSLGPGGLGHSDSGKTESWPQNCMEPNEEPRTCFKYISSSVRAMFVFCFTLGSLHLKLRCLKLL